MLLRAAMRVTLALLFNALLGVAPAQASLNRDLVTLGNRHYLRGEISEAREAYRVARPGSLILHLAIRVIVRELIATLRTRS